MASFEGGGSTCHVLALFNVKNADDHFHFNEIKYRWTNSELLRILINLDWKVLQELLFLLKMLLSNWNIIPFFANGTIEDKPIQANA